MENLTATTRGAAWAERLRLGRRQTKYFVWGLGGMLVLAIGGSLLFFDLGARVLATNDDTRFPMLARDVLAHGTWWVPRLNGIPHLNKPPLHAWLIALLAWPAGTVTQHNAAVASLLAALVVVITTAWIGRRLFDAASGLIAGAVVITTYGVFTVARQPLPDMTMCAAMTAAMGAYVVYDQGHRRGALVAFYALTAVAFWAKGPAGLLPLVVAVADTAARSGRRGLRRFVVSSGFVVLLALLALWWVVATTLDRRQFVHDVVITDSLLWYVPTSTWHAKLVTEPFVQALTIFAPWCVLLPLAIWAAVRTRETAQARSCRLLLLWAGTMFVLLGLSAQQRMRYYLPLAAPLALIIAAWWPRLPLRRPRTVFVLAWSVAALGVTVWHVHETRRDNATTDLGAIVREIVSAPPGPVYAVDVPELVISFYSWTPVTALASIEDFEPRPGHVVVADRALRAGVPTGLCRTARGLVNRRAVSLLTSGPCPSGRVGDSQ